MTYRHVGVGYEVGHFDIVRNSKEKLFWLRSAGEHFGRRKTSLH